MPYTVFLKKNEERRIINGHPWVYANEVLRIEGKDKNGSLATVLDYNGKFVGKGYINHLSKILVRVFIRKNDVEPDLAYYKEKIKEANDYRIKIGYNDCYRMVYAEADNLPALIIDKYHDIFSVQFLSLGIELNKELIIKSLIELYNPQGIYERSDVAVRAKEGLPLTKGKLYGEFDTRVIVEENGVKMCVDLENGQKTGYFLDQKENRYAIRRYVKDCTVLDCFCNSGGFSMNAVIGGAKSVIALDISEQALKDVRENARLNSFEDKITTMGGDVFDVLRTYRKENKTFDVIVLDPPAFCKSVSEVNNAYKGYKDINILAMKLINKGGFLVTSSCSHFISFPMFEKMLIEAAKESGKTVRSVELKTQAGDHPSLLAEEETLYLKFFVLHIV